MSRQSTKSAGRSSKTSRSTAKKTAKPAAKSARGTVKKASKSARQPVGKTQASKTALGKSQVEKTLGKAPAIKAQAAKSSSIKPSSIKTSAIKPQTAVKTAPRPASRLPEPSAAAPIIHTLSPPVQPIVVPDVPLRAHRYQVGETVYYTSPTFGRAAATGSYTIVKLLPTDGDDYQYRIKSSGEAFERVAKESQLDKP